MDFVYGKITTAYILFTNVTKCIYYAFFIRQHNTCLLFEHQTQTENYLSFLLYYTRKELFNTFIIYMHFICIVKFLYIFYAIHIHIIFLLVHFWKIILNIMQSLKLKLNIVLKSKTEEHYSLNYCVWLFCQFETLSISTPKIIREATNGHPYCSKTFENKYLKNIPFIMYTVKYKPKLAAFY
jgi:hypothetical protein